MLTRDIFRKIDELIPKELALENDKIGYFGINYQNTDINKIKIILDILPIYDEQASINDLFITHYPPVFTPRTPTYTINTNWDICKGGSNDALCQTLNLEVVSSFDKKTGIGRICSCYKYLNDILLDIKEIFGLNNIRMINGEDPDKKIRKVAVVAGSGLSNLKYIKLAKERRADLFISGDLTHSAAILAKKLNLTLLDISSYYSQTPGIYALADLLSTIGIPIEVIDSDVPWKPIKL